MSCSHRNSEGQLTLARDPMCRQCGEHVDVSVPGRPEATHVPCDVCTEPCSGDRVVCGGCLQITSDLVKTGAPIPRRSEAQPCGAYVGDNDGTCPQLTCVRPKGHDGLHDNVSGDGCSRCGAETRNLDAAGNVICDRCRSGQRSAAATPVDYDGSFDRLGDIIDEQFGLQPVMTPAEKLTFLWRRIVDDRREMSLLLAVAEAVEESMSIETPRSVVRALRAWRELTDQRRAAAKTGGTE